MAFTISTSMQRQLHTLNPDLRRAKIASLEKDYKEKIKEARAKADEELQKRLEDIEER